MAFLTISHGGQKHTINLDHVRKIEQHKNGATNAALHIATTSHAEPILHYANETVEQIIQALAKAGERIINV